MKIAYFDCFSGASGDMILGSLMDAGLPLEKLKNELAKLHLTGYDIQIQKVLKKGIGGTQAIVNIAEPHPHDHDHDSDHHHHDDDHHHHHHDHDHEHEHDHHHHHHDDDHEHDHHHDHDHHHHPHDEHDHDHPSVSRNFHDIKHIIEDSELDDLIKQRSIEIFLRLGEAEAKVHRTSIETIHFHEVGAMDAIIDIVGAVIGLSLMGIDQVFCSPLHVGSGTVECAHGTLPVPAPATAELIKGKPIYSTGVKGELLTPTGAAILTTLASDFGAMPSMTLEAIGYGAGTSEPEIANLLRVVIGELPEDVGGYEYEQVAVIETNIDDMNPQMYDYLIESLLGKNALDVFLTPLHMKKNRPGIMMSVICKLEYVQMLSDFLLRETTSIGLRWRIDHRIKLHREIETVQTQYGNIRCKIGKVGNHVVNATPEYEDCKRLAKDRNVPLKEVMEVAKSKVLSCLSNKK